jgi:hypothetical protein
LSLRRTPRVFSVRRAIVKARCFRSTKRRKERKLTGARLCGASKRARFTPPKPKRARFTFALARSIKKTNVESGETQKINIERRIKFMKKTILRMTMTLSVLTVIFLAAHADARAQNGWIPPGSYQKSCKQMRANISPENNDIYLIAVCNEAGVSFGKGDPFPSYLNDFYLCDGDIANIDSILKCTKNDNSKLMQTARAAVKSGWAKATGSQPSAQEISDTVRQMILNGYAPQFSAA